jgi:hypothetical protein
LKQPLNVGPGRGDDLPESRAIPSILYLDIQGIRVKAFSGRPLPVIERGGMGNSFAGWGKAERVPSVDAEGRAEKLL